LRSPALILGATRGCHAVLAAVSRCCSPLGGRSPTRYSPVRRSTWGLPPFRARLACVRHAASVDSEPGSNSPVKLATLRIDLSAGPRRPSILKVLFGPCELNLAGIFSRLPSFQRATPSLGEPDQNTETRLGCQPFSGLCTIFFTAGGHVWVGLSAGYESVGSTAPGVTPPAETDSTSTSAPCQALSPTFSSSSGDFERAPRYGGL
jgi:hypothetical protein